ncbi:MAG: ACT domain-containing protein [Dehalococcoidia bacterium]|jgi:malate dehydrogenase (oxaloacetate-decarboxylating)|nr:ACT domain-containing protein [Dehalococcoidia bacterium]MDW8008551.1 malic enzyme-like NAD(P)-binding protein [Chloroflexota bacterium]
MLSDGYTITVRAEYPNRPGMLGKVASIVGQTGGDIGAIDIVQAGGSTIVRDFTIRVADEEHARLVVQAIAALPDVRVHQVTDRILDLHRGGKIMVRNRIALATRQDLAAVYTPGVARVCRHIHHHPESVWDYTIKANTVAIVTDGSAILGLGNLGPEAALPVMEGKAMLFKEFGGVDAWPICLATQDVDEIVRTVTEIAPAFGGINLEDIAAPRCFAVQERLQETLDIPVFHDDQDGTAVVVLAGLRNALKLVGKRLEDLRVVISGAGAAGYACARLLLSLGVREMLVVDRAGIIYEGRDRDMDPYKRWLAENTNREGRRGSLSDAMEGADFFLGVSVGDLLSAEDLQKMAPDPIVFALANPDPEIRPEVAEPYVRVMATGRSDFPNQINNALCFPGLFRGALDARARTVNLEMKLAAAEAIAAAVDESELSEEYIIPSIFKREMFQAVAQAVREAAIRTGVARVG